MRDAFLGRRCADPRLQIRHPLLELFELIPECWRLAPSAVPTSPAASRAKSLPATIGHELCGTTRTNRLML